jgi:hypothetical protein
MIRQSIEILQSKHKNNVNMLEKYLLGEISLQSFDELYSGNLSNELKKCHQQIIYKQLI